MENVSSAPERRGRSNGMLKRLIDTRTDMLSLYGELAQLKPLTDMTVVPSLLQRFCQSLVDYMANAHFQLYRYFAEDNERRMEIYQVATLIYPRILEITDMVLDFNDKYDCEDRCGLLTNLESDLSLLGENLADRIELEDRLIGAFGEDAI